MFSVPADYTIEALHQIRIKILFIITINAHSILIGKTNKKIVKNTCEEKLKKEAIYVTECPRVEYNNNISITVGA